MKNALSELSGSAFFKLNRKLPEKQSSNTDESALNILKKRYALGEIGKEDYEKMKKEISLD